MSEATIDELDGIEEPYPGWTRDARDAREKFTVDYHVHDGTDRVRYVEASAGTGTRYCVVVSRLPYGAAAIEGGPILVTVLSPWQDAWVLSDTGYLALPYIAERLCDGRAASRLNGGDLMALTLLVRYVLGRG